MKSKSKLPLFSNMEIKISNVEVNQSNFHTAFNQLLTLFMLLACQASGKPQIWVIQSLVSSNQFFEMFLIDHKLYF